MRWRKVKVEPLDPLLIKRVSDSAPLSRSREIQSVLKERQSVSLHEYHWKLMAKCPEISLSLACFCIYSL